MTIRPMTEEDWPQVWPFFRAILFNAVVETNASAVHLWEAFDSATHGLVGLHVMHLPLD